MEDDESVVYVFGDPGSGIQVALAANDRDSAAAWLRDFLSDPASGQRAPLGTAGHEITRGAVTVDGAGVHGVAVLYQGRVVGIARETAGTWVELLEAGTPGVFDIIEISPVMEG